MTIDAAAIRLTDAILGEDEPDLEQTLKALAANIEVLHIAYAPLCSQKSEDANLFRALCTYPVAWQVRYFKKQYASIDPVIARGSEAVLPFDWDELPRMIRPLKHFLTTRLITIWVATGCRSQFETAREFVFWFPSRAITRRTTGRNIKREI